MSLTPEQIAADFCAANPGKSVSVNGITRDAAGNVRYSHTTETKRMVNNSPSLQNIPKSKRRVFYVSNRTVGSKEKCPNCGQLLIHGHGGGVQCPDKKCGYWFCF